MWRRLDLPDRCIGGLCQLRQGLEKLLALTGEQSIVGERGCGGLCAGELVGRGANHRAVRQIRRDEFTGDGEDEAGLEEWIVRGEEIRKCKATGGHRGNRGLY